MKTFIETNDFIRVNNDTNGNPRYVCHFLHFICDNRDQNLNLNNRYITALSRAKEWGGRKFHNKQYGGGVVFQSYNLHNLCRYINEELNKAFASEPQRTKNGWSFEITNIEGETSTVYGQLKRDCMQEIKNNYFKNY